MNCEYMCVVLKVSHFVVSVLKFMFILTYFVNKDFMYRTPINLYIIYSFIVHVTCHVWFHWNIITISNINVWHLTFCKCSWQSTHLIFYATFYYRFDLSCDLLLLYLPKGNSSPGWNLLLSVVICNGIQSLWSIKS